MGSMENIVIRLILSHMRYLPVGSLVEGEPIDSPAWSHDHRAYNTFREAAHSVLSGIGMNKSEIESMGIDLESALARIQKETKSDDTRPAL